MDETAVQAAAERIWHEAHGLFMGTGEECRMVPVSALDDLFVAVGFDRFSRSRLGRLVAEARGAYDALLAPQPGAPTERVDRPAVGDEGVSA